MTNKYDDRELVYVTPYTGAVIKYGFATNMKEAGQNDLGQVTVDFTALPTGLVFGANAPKPGRASRLIATTGNQSSYYDISKRNTLKADGWRVSSPTIRRGSATARAIACYVTIDGIKYAWMMPKETATKIGDADFGALGIELADGSEKDLVWGASSPKPQRVSAVKTDAVISTFADPSKLGDLPTGWSIFGKEKVN